jgi:DNA-binding NtrC family response regulator
VRESQRSDAGLSPLGAVNGQSASHLTELVGRVPLKDLVRDTADIIEKLCIEAALKLTDNNRASAADMLGLSRQSLYIKLRRYGISDNEEDVG